MPDRIRFWLAVVELSLLAATGLVAVTSHAQASPPPESAAATMVVVTRGGLTPMQRVGSMQTK